MIHTYKISGMTCGNCVARVKSELLKTGDILSADVQLASPQAKITMARHIPTSKLQEVVNRAGNYQITDDKVDMPLTAESETEPAPGSYFPVFLIFGYIAGVTLLVQFTGDGFSWMNWMRHFMAGFFLVFSFFKLLNLRGFAESYAGYDIVARKLWAWGFVYPFVELGLGIAYLWGGSLLIVSLVTFIVMGLSSLGVIQSLLRRSSFQCACLGTVIKLPLSKLTLFEDLLMIAMSALMVGGLLR